MKSLILAIALAGTVVVDRADKIELPPKHKIDVLLITYEGENADLKLGETFLKRMSRDKIPCNRAITYPDGYVPVLIPKSEVENVRKLLNNRFLEISPALK